MNRTLARVIVSVAILAVVAGHSFCADRPVTAPSAGKPTEVAREWALKDLAGEVMHPGFAVSGDGQYVYIWSTKKDFQGWKHLHYLLETQSGKLYTVEELFAGKIKEARLAPDVAFSPDGKYMAVRDESSPAIWVLRLDNKTAVKVPETEGVMAKVWVGSSLAMTSADLKSSTPTGEIGAPPDVKRMKSLPLKLYDPLKNTTTSLNIHAVVVASAPNGKVLIAMRDKDDPTRPVNIYDYSPGWCAMTLDGKMLQPLIGSMGPGVFSADGNYLAFCLGEGTPPAVAKVKILSINDGGSQEIDVKETPVWVKDLNTVITTDWAMKSTMKDSPLVYRNGKSAVTIVKAARAAAVAGDRLFYITGSSDSGYTLHAEPLSQLLKNP